MVHPEVSLELPSGASAGILPGISTGTSLGMYPNISVGISTKMSPRIALWDYPGHYLGI